MNFRFLIFILFLILNIEFYKCQTYTSSGEETYTSYCKDYSTYGSHIDYPGNMPKVSREDWILKMNSTTDFNGTMFQVCNSDPDYNLHELFNRPNITAQLPPADNPYLNDNKRNIEQASCTSLITSQSDIVYYVGNTLKVKKVVQFVVDRKDYDFCFKVDTQSTLPNGTIVKLTSPQKVIRFKSFQEEYGLTKAYSCRTNVRIDNACRCCCSGIVDNRCDNYRNFCNEDFGSVEWWRCTSRFLSVTGNGCARTDLAGRAVCTQKLNTGDAVRVGLTTGTGNKYLIINSLGTLDNSGNKQITIGSSFKSYNATFDILGSYTYNRYQGGDFLSWPNARVVENYNNIDQWDRRKACWIKEDNGMQWQWSEFIDSLSYIFSQCCTQWWVPEDLRPKFLVVNQYHPTELDKERTLQLNVNGYGNVINYNNERFLIDYNYMPSIVLRMEMEDVSGISFSIVYAVGITYKCIGNGSNFTPINIVCTVNTFQSAGLDTLKILNGDVLMTETKINVQENGQQFNTSVFISTPGQKLLKACGLENVCTDFLVTIAQEGSINTENITQGNPSDPGKDSPNWLNADIDLNKLFEQYPWIIGIIVAVGVIILLIILCCVARCTRCFQECGCCGRDCIKPNKTREKIHIMLSKGKEKVQKQFKPKKKGTEYENLKEEESNNTSSILTEEEDIELSPTTKKKKMQMF